ncbi:Tfp pilus assembly protein FimT/FimU [Vibrio hangzhouensis]|uniref:MSHA pilin protein MshC n=1 Tax=Vibrio hangzhouensis TaxID=462991 RepID=A0A1H5U894_9VIBR|nr:type II secretion system protein [Vibrio hangzhouensis]MBY6197075.1 type II secretion system GspH family protein [Vibrio hangzhouensis]SEF70658.1 MSHA pilin protein MshC [Vibrio hangzhouensis]
MPIQPRKLAGFTLIELIVVLILLSVISVVAASRFMGRSGFSVEAAKEQAVAIVQQIQLGRMQSNINEVSDLNRRYQLVIQQDCFGSRYSCSQSNKQGQSDYLQLEGVQVSAPLNQIDFDLLGRPVCDSCTFPIQIQFSQHSDSASLCINSEGFVDAC